MSTTVATVQNFSLTVDPKVKTAEGARDMLVGFVKNPPQSPIEFVKFAADFTGVGASVTGALSSIIPGGAFIMPALSAIFSLFGGGGPSVGELTLTAIHDLGVQVSKIAEQLQSVLSSKIEASAQKVINVVLSGQTEIAREQTAVAVFVNTIQADLLDQVEAEKNIAYADFLDETQKIQNEAIERLTAMLNAARAAVDSEYAKQLTQIIAMIQQMSAELIDFFNMYLAANVPVPIVANRALPASQTPTATQPQPSESGNMIIYAGIGGLILWFLFRKKR